MDEETRSGLYDQYHLTCNVIDGGIAFPLLIGGPGVRFSRSGEAFNAMQVEDLMKSYPETRALMSFPYGRVGLHVGLDLAALVARDALVTVSAGAYSVVAILDGVSVFGLLNPGPDVSYRLVDTYNQALARAYALAPPPPIIRPAPLPAGQGWLGGSLCLEGFLGMSVQSRSELDHFYGRQLWAGEKPWAPSLLGGAVDYALTDRLQVGLEFDPFLPKRAHVEYTNGATESWTLDAVALLARIRVFTPLTSRLGLVMTGGLGQYSLSGAKLQTNYWYGTRAITGSAIGGYGEIGLERLLGTKCGIHVGVGYREARIVSNDQGNVWAAASRNGALLVDHSGPFFATSYRYYWGIARSKPAPAPVSEHPNLGSVESPVP